MAQEKSSIPEWADFTLVVKGKRLLATASSREELMPLLDEVRSYRPECEYIIEPGVVRASKKGAKDHHFSLWQVMPKPDNSALDD